MREACDARNRVFAVGYMEAYADEVHDALTGAALDSSEKNMTSLGKLSVMEIKRQVILDDGQWHYSGGSQEKRTSISSSLYMQNQINLFGTDVSSLYPTPNATHLFLTETKDGKNVLDKILGQVPTGEFCVNGAKGARLCLLIECVVCAGPCAPC